MSDRLFRSAERNDVNSAFKIKFDEFDTSGAGKARGRLLPGSHHILAPYERKQGHSAI